MIKTTRNFRETLTRIAKETYTKANFAKLKKLVDYDKLTSGEKDGIDLIFENLLTVKGLDTGDKIRKFCQKKSAHLLNYFA